jgi:hypothetical protein
MGGLLRSCPALPVARNGCRCSRTSRTLRRSTLPWRKRVRTFPARKSERTSAGAAARALGSSTTMSGPAYGQRSHSWPRILAPPAARRLRGRPGYRVRVGDHRIIYIVADDILLMLSSPSRTDATSTVTKAEPNSSPPSMTTATPNRVRALVLVGRAARTQISSSMPAEAAEVHLADRYPCWHGEQESPALPEHGPRGGQAPLRGPARTTGRHGSGADCVRSNSPRTVPNPGCMRRCPLQVSISVEICP